MHQAKIKRVQKHKRKITAKEKIFAGIGLASNLIGGGGGVAAQKVHTRIVSSNTHSQNSKQSQSLMSKIFGIKTAKADMDGAAFINEAATSDYDQMYAKYGSELDGYIYQWLNTPSQYPSAFTSSSLAAQLLGLQGAEAPGASYSGFTFQGDGMWHNSLPVDMAYTNINNNFIEQPIVPVDSFIENQGTETGNENPGEENNIDTSGLPESFAFNDAYKVLGLSNNYSIMSAGQVPRAIYTQDNYYQIQSDYTYKKSASGAQARSLITSGGIAVGTIYVTKKYGVSGLISKLMGLFKGKAATAGVSSGQVLPATGKVMTSSGWEMDLGDAIDVVQNDANEAFRLGLNDGMESKVTTSTGAEPTLSQAASWSTDPVIGPSFGLGAIAPAVVGGIAVGIAAGAGGGATAGGVAAITSTITYAGGLPVSATVGAIPSTLPGTLSALPGGAAIYTPGAAGVGAAGSGTVAGGTAGTATGSTSIFSSVISSIHSALSTGITAVGTALQVAATWVGGLVGAGAAAGATIIGGVVVGAILGIRAILNRGQDKIRDSRRIEEVNPYIFQIVDAYNSASGNTIEEEIIFHDESQKAVLQLYQSVAAKFERSQSEASQSLYIDAYLHGGNVPGPNGQMVNIAGMDATFNQRMEAHKANLNFDVYENLDGTRVAYPSPGSGLGQPWGKVTVSFDGQGNITSAVSESGQILPMSILTSIVAAEGSRLKKQSNILMLMAGELPRVKVGENFSAALNHMGGEGELNFEIVEGNLPVGLELNSSSGQITGAAQEAGHFSFTAKVTDASGQSHSQAFNIYVSAAQRTAEELISLAHVIAFNSLSNAEKTDLQAYLNQHPNAIIEQNFDSFHRGTIMAWALGMGNSVELSDSAKALGFTAYDEASGLFIKGESGENSGNLSISQINFPEGKVGQAFSYQFTAGGGSGPYAWAVPSGILPLGLTISPQGEISGTPSQNGAYNFSVQVTDSQGLVKRLDNLRIIIAPAITVIGTSVVVKNAQGSPMAVNGSQTPNVGYTFNKTTNSSGQTVFNISINNGATYTNLTISDLLAKIQENLASNEPQKVIEGAALSNLYYSQIYNSPTAFNAQGQVTAQPSSTYAANNLTDGSSVTNLARQIQSQNPGMEWNTALSQARAQVSASLASTNYAGGTVNFGAPQTGASTMSFENPATHNLSFRDGSNWQLSVSGVGANQNIYIQGTWIKPGGETVELNELVGRTDASGRATVTRQLSNYHMGDWNVRVTVGSQQVGGALSFKVGS